MGNLVVCPAPSDYSKPTLPTVISRKSFFDSGLNGSDMDIAVSQIYKLAELEAPPLRLALGQDSIANIRAQLSLMTKEVDEFASWSDKLTAQNSEFS